MNFCDGVCGNSSTHYRGWEGGVRIRRVAPGVIIIQALRARSWSDSIHYNNNIASNHLTPLPFFQYQRRIRSSKTEAVGKHVI